MTWLVALAVVGALMASTVMFFRRKPDPSRRADASRFDRFAPLPPLELTEPDALELAELGRRVEQDFGLAPVQILLHRLGNVTRRSVPLRAVRPGPARGLARICFADGTTLQVRGRQVGDLGYLAATAITQKVWVSNYHTEHSTVVLDLDWNRGRVSVLAVGLDQAD
ncbi:MAG: hypothetical protein R2703_16205 [Micropruina glycogenica]|jgi:hypothetical protein|nr:hypothetical protein [Propionibacteriaceae bacterium]